MDALVEVQLSLGHHADFVATVDEIGRHIKANHRSGLRSGIVLVESFTKQGQFDDAIRAGIQSLKSLGMPISSKRWL